LLLKLAFVERSQIQENIMVDEDIITLTADIVSAHVGNNSVSVADVPALIATVHSALADLGKPPEPEAEILTPAVSIRASIKPDYIVCLEDGKKLKMLKRHLMTHYQMTPEQYRAKWKLPSDYPMVAPAYASQRKDLALKIGLGRKKGEVAPVKAKAETKPVESAAAKTPRATKTLSIAVNEPT
jgi:predicted transcriptional regulator